MHNLRPTREGISRNMMRTIRREDSMDVDFAGQLEDEDEDDSKKKKKTKEETAMAPRQGR